MIDFSIIIPAKNEEKFLADCLDSIRSVDYPADRFEIIVVDNGSVDRTIEIAREKGAVVYLQPNLTISGLRNYGARRATGRIFAFIDADCTVSVRWLICASRYIGRSDIAAFGSAPVVPPAATWVQRAWSPIRKKKSVVEDVKWLESMNLFVPADIFRTVNGFNENMTTCEDYEFSMRLKKLGRIVSDQEILAIHHGEAASVVSFFHKERWRATSNYKELNMRHIEKAEILGIIMPLVQILLISCFLLLEEMTLFGYISLMASAIFIVIWQMPLVLFALRKCSPKSPILLMQLLFLLNIYFLARGCAIFSGAQRRYGCL